MALFGKKDPCPICGGKIGMLASKVGGQKICNGCYGLVDLPQGATDHMTLDAFRGYMAFREENLLLKGKFHVTQQVDFGFFDTKFMFDANNRLLCMDKSLGKTIFEGKDIQSFVIKEDSAPLFEGTSAGLRRYTSTVPDRVMAMSPQISQMAAQAQMERNMERMMDRMEDQRTRGRGDGPNLNQNDHRYHRTFRDIAEPFRAFNVEIRFQHPYWTVFTADRNGPTFNNDYPSVDNYLREYHEAVRSMEELALALMTVAFPGAPDIPMNPASPQAAYQGTAAPAAGTDPVLEIQRFKTLLDQGIITQEEFAAKKRQLLGL